MDDTNELSKEKTYGSIELADNAKAHLGDNILKGTITIQQLNLMVGEEQAQTIISDFTKRDSRASNATKFAQQSSKNCNSPATAISIICRALLFREESFREYDVKAAHSATFGWVFHYSHFTNWLQNGNGCYWINGKPGSGKSTFLKYIITHSTIRDYIQHWAASRRLISASFFFWRVGTPLQRSHEGILRSLLHQILHKYPELTPILFPKLFLHVLLGKPLDVFNLSELQHAIERLLVAIPQNLCMFLAIDGVDEYDGDYFDFCQLLVRISACASIKILVSSRPIPPCFQVFSRHPSLRMQDLTICDVRRYIQAELLEDPLLQEMDLLEPGIVVEIESALVQKASGVFLWIVLVVKNILVALGNYEDRETLLSRIDQLPSDLEKLYEYLFSSMDLEHRREGIMLIDIFQWTTHRQPIHGMTAIQMSYCDISKKQPSVTRCISPLSEGAWTLRQKVVEGRLRHRCRGLLEVNDRPTHDYKDEPEVQYLHRTVKEYLDAFPMKNQQAEQEDFDHLGIHRIVLASYAPTIRAILSRSNCSEKLQTWIQKPESSHRIYELMNACLRVSKEFEGSGDLGYLDSMISADLAIMPESLGGYGTTFEMYNAIYWSLYSAKFPTRYTSTKTSSHGLALSSKVNAAMYFIAAWGLSCFWRHKLDTTKPEVFSQAGVLLKLLEDVKRDRWTHQDSMTRNIEILISVLDVNQLVAAKDNPWDVTDFDALQYVKDNAARLVSPWNYWLAIRPHFSKFEHRITLAFIKAGAKLSSNDLVKDGALQEFITQIRGIRARSRPYAAGTSAQAICDLLTYLITTDK